MQSFLPLLLTISGPFFQYAVAAPTVPEERGLIGNAVDGADSILEDVFDELQSLSPSATGSGQTSKALNALQKITATATPSSPERAMSSMSAIYEASPTPNNLYAAIAQVVSAGLASDNVGEAVDFVQGLLDGENSMTNINTRNPNPKAYPKAQSTDAPYDLTEAQLRQVIYIPPTFKYGKGAQPIILVPGTGNTGYTTFKGNYIPLLQTIDPTIADPVWLNIPNYLLNDAQTNAEYVAYAINYIYGISQNRKVAVLAWSQGNIDAQWAYKYWPSTRSRVTDHIAISADYHGTVLADFIALGEALPPSVLQQEYNSRFITALRRNGGDAAYVPTTTIYSGFFDEVVEPQQGTGASAYLLSSRLAQASNNEVQTVCAGQLAGSFYTHEGMLYNPLGYALLKDALSHNGPGNSQRLDLGSVCSSYLTPGLDLADLGETENTLLTFGASFLVYPSPVVVEPAIKSYAQKY